MALSLRTPRPESRHKRPSIPTVRPVSATLTPLPLPATPAKSALPLYVSFGFALGIGIVVAARLTVQPHHPEEANAAAEPGVVAVESAAAVSAATVAPSASAPVASASASTRPKLTRPSQPPSDPLSRRK